MIPLLAKLLGGRWRSGGHLSDSVDSVLGDDQIIIQWHIEDVQDVRPDLDNDQARQVLHQCKADHDATVGINWDTLQWHADALFPVE